MFRNRHELSFILPTPSDPYRIALVDTSLYRNDPPQMPVGDVLFPGEDAPISFHVRPGEVTPISMHLKGYVEGREKLPDGVYEVGYSVAPNGQTRVCKLYLQSAQGEENLRKWMDTVNWEAISGCAKENQTMLHLMSVLEGSRAAALMGDKEKATNLYTLFTDLLCPLLPK